MDWPIGRAVGNANEVMESIETLKGRGPVDLVEQSLDLAERMLVSAGVAGDRHKAHALALAAITSGRAVEKFRAIIERQNGNPRVVDDYSLLPQAPEEHVVRAPSAGFVVLLDAGLIGRASVTLGGGRDTVEDTIDPGVGIIISATVGDAVQKGDAILRLHYREAARLQAALPLLAQGVKVAPDPPPAKRLIIDEVV
jgi:pyrimidine-nucleoside phosphorylase/thymidine phosphorylase